MADMITGTVTGFVNNMPESTLNTVNDMRREQLGAIKDARHDIISATDADTDRVEKSITDAQDNILNRLFTMGRDTMDLRAQVTSLGTYVKDAATISAQATQLSVQSDGEKTRALLTQLNNDALNRALIERNAEIIEERHHARHWRGNYDQSQWAALNTQLQAFQSSLAETRQGMVNFGTMAGVGQTSSTNQV